VPALVSASIASFVLYGLHPRLTSYSRPFASSCLMPGWLVPAWLLLRHLTSDWDECSGALV
jgi:hypothetical protein